LFDAADRGAERGHAACAIAHADHVGLDRQRVAALLQDHQLAVVQRDRVHPHQHLVRAGLRHLVLAQHQTVEACAQRHVITLHARASAGLDLT
jgi:hypothetical protein